MKHLRIIHLKDTDAAGVIYFANLLSICHEAYEASIRDYGLELKQFFSSSQLALPITHAEIDFKRPLFCGEQIEINLEPILVSENEFSINYQVFLSPSNGQELAIAQTIHVCINPTTRKRQSLPESLLGWIKKGKIGVN